MDCIRCKGRVESRFACGRDFCPVYARSEAMFRSVEAIGKNGFQGTSPSVFVGRYGYPSIKVGILSPPGVSGNAELFDAPGYWADNSYTIKKVVELRSSLVNSRFDAEIRKPSRSLGFAQEIAMSSRPVDVDIKLFEKPKPKISFSGVALPMGPSAPLRKVDLMSNPKISSRVERVVSDTDLKSAEGLVSLYRFGLGENELSKILSVGVLGLKRRRKLVPTRWSITATDDLLAKDLIKGVKSFNCAEYQLFYGGLYGNYYFVMFFPDVWSYELFEGYMPRSLWNQSCDISFVTDYEPYTGRKNYAENTAGGYYAARLPVVEKLNELRRQASVLVLRFVTDEYSCPLGVFVCREAVRKALNSKPVRFSSREEMLDHMKGLIKTLFNFDITSLLKQSILLRGIRAQTKLSLFSPEPDPYQLDD